MLLEELMERENKKRMNSKENHLIDANTKLMDKFKWIREDIEKEIYKIKTHDLSVEKIVNDLENILKNNN